MMLISLLCSPEPRAIYSFIHQYLFADWFPLIHSTGPKMAEMRQFSVGKGEWGEGIEDCWMNWIKK
jgi:hypothetical protein